MENTTNKINEIESSPGVVSSMRKTLVTARRLGTFMIVSAVVFGALAIVLKTFEILTFATVLISAGSAMITGMGFAKAQQSKTEQE